MSSVTLESTSLEVTPEFLSVRFSALGDPIRLRILDHLAVGQTCVCELLEKIQVPANLLSYHLRVLREAGLIMATRRGRWIDYRLDEDALESLRQSIPSAGARVRGC